MLKALRVKNIALIADTDIEFAAGLNIISGETGSGKSSLMTALKLSLGGRLDTDFIRTGETKALIQAQFSVPECLKERFEEDTIILTREFSGGKSRALINDRIVTAATLDEVGKLLVDVSTQGAKDALRNEEAQGLLLDAFAEASSLRSELQAHFLSWTEAKNTLQMLQKASLRKEKALEELHKRIELLESSSLLSEEKALFAEYSALEEKREAQATVSKAAELISSEWIARLERAYQGALRFPLIAPLATSLAALIEEARESAFQCELFLEAQTAEDRLHQLGAAFHTIDLLKAEFGQDLDAINQALAQAKTALGQLENLEEELLLAKEAEAQSAQAVTAAAAALSAKRAKGAKRLSEAVTSHLQSLNMEGSRFLVALIPQELSQGGKESIQFQLQANRGEGVVDLGKTASGGELSRLFLAIKACMAGKSNIPVLLLDEVDANLSGRTGAVLAQRLKEISSNHQVIAITHLPSVAQEADHHLGVDKEHVGGRTHTRVRILNKKEKKAEIERMIGLDSKTPVA